MTKAERTQQSHQPRKHYKGKMGKPVAARGGMVVVMRSHTHGGHSRAFAGWTCDDTKDPRIGKTGKETKSAALAPYKVTMPHGRIRYVRPQEAYQ